MKIYVHWVNLMKNQIIHKFQSLEIKKKKGYKAKRSFFNDLTKYMFNGFKMSSFKCRWCRSHVKEIILPKKLDCTFFVINQNIDTQSCMDMKNHHHHINNLKLDCLIFFT
jgi:hypothetical protein